MPWALAFTYSEVGKEIYRAAKEEIGKGAKSSSTVETKAAKEEKRRQSARKKCRIETGINE